jgi:Ion channel
MARPTTLAADAPLWRKHLHGDGYGYGWLLLLILVTIGFQMGAPEASWARVITLFLQGATLIAALHISGVRRWMVHFATVVTAIALVGAAGVVIGSGDLGLVGGRILGLMLVILAPMAIIVGIVRQARRAGAITLRTMFGVLCVYLLIGSAFAFAYGIIGAAGNADFFAEIHGGDQSDFLYFSFSTMTTTGFGDLTAAADLGRSLAIMEALIGQIYLVTIVALIVSNLGQARVARR